MRNDFNTVDKENTPDERLLVIMTIKTGNKEKLKAALAPCCTKGTQLSLHAVTPFCMDYDKS